MNHRLAHVLIRLSLLLLLVCQAPAHAAQDGGDALTASLWARAVLQVPGSPVTLIWKMVGADITPSGDQVISGYFYADPDDFAYGSVYNPEVFVKIYIATNGWCNIAFNHVTVDDVTVETALNYAGTPDQSGSVTLDSRLAEHQYNGVSIDSSLKTAGLLSGGSSGVWKGLSDDGIDDVYLLSSALWAKAVLQVAGSPINLVWREVGADLTPSGDLVVSGYFYADPNDFAYGSVYNPEVFVKAYIATNGWANIAFNHVTVDGVAIRSSHQSGSATSQDGTVTLAGRLLEHTYTGVTIETLPDFTAVEPVVVHFSAADPVEAASGTIASTGGSLAVASPGSPLDGLRIDVPDGAYAGATTFTISYQTVSTTDLPQGIDPIGPMIEVDNGGAYAELPITMTIPLDIPAGNIAVPLYYDETTGQVEVIPMVSQSADGITLMTRHFSKVFCVRANLAPLREKVQTSLFTLGKDDWPFSNDGGYLSPGGNCSGMVSGAMWYYRYRHRLNGAPALRTLDGSSSIAAVNQSPLKPFTLDDDLHQRFVSVAQTYLQPTDTLIEAMTEKILQGVDEGPEVELGGDSLAFYQTVISLELGQPVLIGLSNTPSGNEKTRKHAVVCYAVDKTTLYIYDPNFPYDSNNPKNSQRKLKFKPDAGGDTGSFEAYNTAPNTSLLYALGISPYDRVLCFGITSVYRMTEFGKYWTSVESGDIGNSDYPPYYVRFASYDDKDALVESWDENIAVDTDIAVNAPRLKLSLTGSDFTGRLTLYDHATVAAAVASGSTSFPALSADPLILSAGSNIIGVLVESFHADAENQKDADKWRWFDFQWINVVYTPPAEPCDVTGRWLMEFDHDQDGNIDSDALWHFEADGSVRHHWSGTIAGYEWRLAGDTFTVVIDGEDFYQGTVAADCRHIEKGTVVDPDVVSPTDWTARRY